MVRDLYQINIVLFFYIDRVQAEGLTEPGLDVVEGHLLDLRDGQDCLLGGLVESGHPTHEPVVAELQPVQQEVLDVGLTHLRQLGLGAPLVVDERELYIFNPGFSPQRTL